MKKNEANEYPYIGKVIKIINEYTIIINVGEDTLEVGDYIGVFEPGILIQDPESDENLGYFSFKKSELQVVECQPKFSVCKAFRKTKSSSFAMALNPLLLTKETLIPLKVVEEQNEKIYLQNNKIAIGDPILTIDVILD